MGGVEVIGRIFIIPIVGIGKPSTVMLAQSSTECAGRQRTRPDHRTDRQHVTDDSGDVTMKKIRPNLLFKKYAPSRKNLPARLVS